MVLGGPWGGFGGMGLSLGEAWEVRFLLLGLFFEGFLRCYVFV